MCNYIFSYSITEIFLLRIRAQIDERENGDGIGPARIGRRYRIDHIGLGLFRWNLRRRGDPVRQKESRHQQDHDQRRADERRQAGARQGQRPYEQELGRHHQRPGNGRRQPRRPLDGGRAAGLEAIGVGGDEPAGQIGPGLTEGGGEGLLASAGDDGTVRVLPPPTNAPPAVPEGE